MYRDWLKHPLWLNTTKIDYLLTRSLFSCVLLHWAAFVCPLNASRGRETEDGQEQHLLRELLCSVSYNIPQLRYTIKKGAYRKKSRIERPEPLGKINMERSNELNCSIGTHTTNRLQYVGKSFKHHQISMKITSQERFASNWKLILICVWLLVPRERLTVTPESSQISRDIP